MSASPVRPVSWRKSTRCATSGCVEIARDGDRIAVRDSKLAEGSPVLTYTAEEWRAFIDGVKAGEFDDLGLGV